MSKLQKERPMETATVNGMTTPASYEEAPLPKRGGPKGLLPSTWLNREVRLEYVDAAGGTVTTRGVLLDWFPFGPALNLSGGRVIVGWDRLVMLELVSD